MNAWFDLSEWLRLSVCVWRLSLMSFFKKSDLRIFIDIIDQFCFMENVIGYE